MTWEDLIIISVAVSLITVMRYLDTMPGYTCPQYCEIDHKHFWIDHPVPTHQSEFLAKSIKPGTYAIKKNIVY
jgi:hypothetical protein